MPDEKTKYIERIEEEEEEESSVLPSSEENEGCLLGDGRKKGLRGEMPMAELHKADGVGCSFR